MAKRAYKHGKRGGGKHVQLSEALQATEAWATLKPGPKVLYLELKRRYVGTNNGQLVLSQRDAARALNVHRNTVGPWFRELEERGFIYMTRAAYLGPSGVGQAPLWALSEVATVDGKPATWAFRSWRAMKKPGTKNRLPRHTNCDTGLGTGNHPPGTVLKIVTGG